MFKLGALVATLTGVAATAAWTSVPRLPPPATKAFVLSLPRATETNASPNKSPGRAVKRSFFRDDDGLFYVDAEVNGTIVRFLVDTGSNTVVLTASDAARSGISRSGTDAGAMQTASGSVRVHGSIIDRIVIAGQSIDNVDAVTVDNGLTVSLLGQSALSRLQSIKFVGKRLDLN